MTVYGIAEYDRGNLRQLLDKGGGNRSSINNGKPSNSNYTVVKITGDIEDGAYPCTESRYINGSWTEYSGGWTTPVNDVELEVNKHYVSQKVAYTEEFGLEFVSFSGSGDGGDEACPTSVIDESTINLYVSGCAIHLTYEAVDLETCEITEEHKVFPLPTVQRSRLINVECIDGDLVKTYADYWELALDCDLMDIEGGSGMSGSALVATQFNVVSTGGAEIAEMSALEEVIIDEED